MVCLLISQGKIEDSHRPSVGCVSAYLRIDQLAQDDRLTTSSMN